MKLNDAMVETARMAQNHGRCCYLYKFRNGTLNITHQVWNDWIFKAYPGGRKQLSVIGSKLLEEESDDT